MTTTLDNDTDRPTRRDFRAVTDLSFQVERGDLYALLATDRAGKASPVVGSDRRSTSRRAVRLRIGSPQESAFSPDLTVKESARLISRLAQRSDTAERVLSLVDLTHKSDTLMSHLTGGETRRLDFASAVYESPELLFLDEPATGQGVQSHDDLWDAVDGLREDGTSSALTSRHLEEARRLADRIGLMQPDTHYRGSTVSELTRTSPSVIQFSVPARVAAPPQATRTSDGTYVIESFGLQRDLKELLMWAEDHSVQLRGLWAGPTRLDDAFRCVGAHHAAA